MIASSTTSMLTKTATSDKSTTLPNSIHTVTTAGSGFRNPDLSSKLVAPKFVRIGGTVVLHSTVV